MSGDRNRVFVSYAHRDRRHLERLRVHLRPLERSGEIDLWDDTRLQPGGDWRREISAAIASTKVAVLLVSADFLASEFIAGNELPPLLAAAREEGAVVLSVLVSPCRFTETPELNVYQAINDPVRPLAVLPVAERERVWVRVADAVEAAFVDRPAAEGWLVTNEKEVLRKLNELIHSAEGSFLIASSGDFYVQFSVQEDHFYCEAVANTYLPAKLHLTEEAEGRLLTLGFRKPTKDGENYSRQYPRTQIATQLRDVAALTVQVFAKVYDVSQNADIELKLSREEPGNA
jgi:T3SS (YopN, CesT) and YbjN peptide-binding chaperone 3/TIR domain